MIRNKIKESWILCTDIDCVPSSDQWIHHMTLGISEHTDMVLGISPMKRGNGSIWNRWMSYDTTDIALNYALWAVKGLPYMSVGRNVLLKKAWWLKQDGIERHRDFVGGDDDLTLQKANHRPEVSVCLHPDARMLTAMPSSLMSYLDSKHRHLDAGRAYKWTDKLMLWLRGLIHLLSWVFLPVLFYTHFYAGIAGSMLFLGLLYLQFVNMKLVDRGIGSFAQYLWSDVVTPFFY